MYIDFRYRPKISDIQNYDLVVLMGDELENPNSTPFKNGTKTKMLLDAITVYNIHNQLKRNPLLLEGGFRAWENTYPMYVESPNNHETVLEFTNVCDDFTNLVQIVKQSNIYKIEILIILFLDLDSELKYPELLSQVVDRPSRPAPVRSPAPNRTVIEPSQQPVESESLFCLACVLIVLEFERNDTRFDAGGLSERRDRMALSDTTHVPKAPSPPKQPSSAESRKIFE